MKSFIKEQGRSQFHSLKNSAMALAVEAAKLMEHFAWVDSKKSVVELEKNREAIEQELPDIDLSQALKKKKKLNQEKYSIEKCKGRSTNYTDL